ncbi:flagellar motor switch phosphatase FliY [Sutcliffiella cohnii]
MNEGMLSQDEIDALLRGTNDDNDTSLLTKVKDLQDHFTEMEQDALGEIGNISFGSSATALSTLLNQKVEITTPKVTLVDQEELESEFPEPYVAIRVNYTDGFSGMNILVIEQKDAAIIADLMLGGNGHSPAELLDEIHLSAVQEAMNQMMGSAATSMSTVFSKKVDISPPSVLLLDFRGGEGKGEIPNEDMLVKVAFNLKIGTLIDSSIMQVLPLPFAKALVEELLNPGGVESVVKEEVKVTNYNEVVTPEPSSDYRNEVVHESYRQPEQHTSVPQPQAAPIQQNVNVQRAEFTSFSEGPVQETGSNNLNMLLDIPLHLTVELGRTKRTVKDILDLSTGSIIELDKLAGEPVDILVNNKLIAQGEVVVIDESFGVRVTDIISQTDRIKKLR